MKAFLYTRGLPLVMFVLTACGFQAAQAHDPGSELTYMTLNGLGSLALKVEGIPRDFSRFGLTSEAVLADTTATLRDNGIQVVSLETVKSEPGAALMKIKLTANENQFRFYYYAVSVEVKQKIPLNNPAGGFISGTIWREGSTGVVMPTDLRKINVLIGELMTKFIKDYRAQNPEKPAAGG